MLATSTRSSKPVPLPIRSVPRSCFNARPVDRLVRADFSRDAHLLDASIAGVVLSFSPRDDEMRETAERSWKIIRALLADHLFGDEAASLPSDGDASIGSPAATEILRKRYAELRLLARTVASVSFENGSDPEISNAGKALCRLAVKLDDLMDGTQRRPVNKLRQYVFSSGKKHACPPERDKGRFAFHRLGASCVTLIGLVSLRPVSTLSYKSRLVVEVRGW